jgi:hypothetical protein
MVTRFIPLFASPPEEGVKRRMRSLRHVADRFICHSSLSGKSCSTDVLRTTAIKIYPCRRTGGGAGTSRLNSTALLRPPA